MITSIACVLITSGMLYCGNNEFRPVNDIGDRSAHIITASDVHVRGYTRSDGVYVQPHVRSAPDGNPYNNYSYGR